MKKLLLALFATGDATVTALEPDAVVVTTVGFLSTTSGTGARLFFPLGDVTISGFFGGSSLLVRLRLPAL